MKRILTTLAQKWPEYLLEILVLVIGIYGAFALERWNENRNLQQQHSELIELLLSDLNLKKEENYSDSRFIDNMIGVSRDFIHFYESEQQLDMTHLKDILRYLSMDISFFDENSPIYNGLSESDLWKQMPDSITTQIDQVYRIRLLRVKYAFLKVSEANTHNRLDFLAYNDLIDLDQDVVVLASHASKVDEELILRLKLLLDGIQRLKGRMDTSVNSIEGLMNTLENYKAQISK